MPKNDFESTNFANFEEVVHNFGRSDDENNYLVKKMLIFNICRRGLMPNLINKSWTVSIVRALLPQRRILLNLVCTK